MTQIIVTLDPKTKARAVKRAKSEGLSFSTVLASAARAFAEGTISLVNDEVKSGKFRLWERQSSLLDKGKGRRFSSATKARAYLKSL